jgi:hypothetical protein
MYELWAQLLHPVLGPILVSLLLLCRARARPAVFVVVNNVLHYLTYTFKTLVRASEHRRTIRKDARQVKTGLNCTAVATTRSSKHTNILKLIPKICFKIIAHFVSVIRLRNWRDLVCSTVMTRKWRA